MDTLTRDKRIATALLILLLLLPPGLGYFGYYLSVGSDQYEVVRFAQDLARGTLFRHHPLFDLVKGRTEPGRLYTVHYGGYLLRDGKMYCKYAIGYPLLLALVLALGGFPAVFFTNFFIYSALLFLIYALGKMYFRGSRSPRFPALAAAFLFFLLIDQAWKLSVTPHGDMAALLFVTACVYFLVRGLPAAGEGRVRFPWLALSGFCLGFSASIRPPNILLAVPAGLYFLSRMFGRMSFLRLVALTIGLSLCIILGLLPVFYQNYATSGNLLKFTQSHEIHVETVKAAVRQAPAAGQKSGWESFIAIFTTRSSGWAIGNIHAAIPPMSFHLLVTFGPLFSLLFLWGLVAGWRKPETRLLFLPIVVTFLVFYSGWVRPLERYLIIVYPFMCLPVLGGAASLLEKAAAGEGRRWVSLVLSVLGALLVAGDFIFRGMNLKLGRPPAWDFQLQYLAALVVGVVLILLLTSHPSRRGRSPILILALVLAAAVLLNAVPIFGYRGKLFQFPQARRFRDDLGRVLRPPSVLFATKFLTQTIDLFTDSLSLRPFDLDFAVPDLGEAYDLLLRNGYHLYLIDNRGKRNAAAYIPPIRDYYSMDPIGQLSGRPYNLEERFGKEACTIYAIERWRKKELAIDLETPVPVDYLLTLYLYKIWDSVPHRSWASASLDGRPLAARLENGPNWFHFSPDEITSARSVFRLASDRGLPEDVRLDFRWEPLDYVIDLGDDAAIPDRVFLSAPGMIPAPGAGWRTLTREARLRIPPPSSCELETAVAYVRKMEGGRGKEGWEIMMDGASLAALPLKDGDDWRTVEFELSPLPGHRRHREIDLRPSGRDAPPLEIEALRLQRWHRSLEVSFSQPGSYFLKAGVRVSDSAPPARLLLDGRPVGDPIARGTVWGIITRGEPASPKSRLEIFPPESGALFHLSLFSRLAYPFRLELGTPESREFKEAGFYLPERYLDITPFCWTGERAELFLPIAFDAPRALVLKIGYIGDRPPSALPAKVEVALGGRRLSEFDLEGGMREKVVTIPSGLLPPGVHPLIIRVPTWCPADHLRSEDARELGMMIRYVELVPAS